MSGAILKREASVGTPRRLRALATGLALGAAALFATAGRLAETPVAAANPLLSAIGPGGLGTLRAAMAAQEKGVPAGLPAKGRAALAGSPLAYEPFLAGAAEGFRRPGASGSTAEAKLLAEAVRRNPRAREARMLLLRHGLATANLGMAVEQLALLTRLGNPDGHRMIEALGATVTSPRQVDETVAAFNRFPDLYDDFLQGFAKRPKPRETSVRLAQRLPDAVMANAHRRGLVLGVLVDAGAFAEAKALWQRHAGGKPGGTVHSPDFTDARAQPPFNWELAENEVGAADRTPGGGVSLVYYGREQGSLVRQLLTLPAGTWRAVVSYTVEATEGGDAGVIFLRLRCAGTPSVLGEMPLRAATGNSARAALTFTVPAGCEGQYLSLEGVTAEGHVREEILVRRIDVAGAGT